MELSCFDHSTGPVDKNRVFKDTRPTKVTQLHGAGDVADWMHKPESTEEMPEWAKESRGGVETLRTTVETGRKLAETPRPVTDRAKERLDDRIVEKIFESRDCLNWYVKRLREAIETMDGDKLYDFIRAHPKYAMTSYDAWNRDFAKLINLKVGEIPEGYRGANAAIRNRRITAAAQRVLVDMYQNDVFQLTFSEPKVNPWIYIDGKMGPYTVSVLNDYWMAKYSPTSSKRPIPPGRSSPNEKSYPRNGKNYAWWLAALRYLDTQTKGMSPQESPPESPPEGKPAHVSFSEQIRREYAALDQAGGSIKMRDLVVEDRGPFDLPMSLIDALGSLYGETPQLKKAPKTYRVMHLLAEKLGAQIRQVRIRTGDRLEITPQGVFTLTAENGRVRHKVNLNA